MYDCGSSLKISKISPISLSVQCVSQTGESVNFFSLNGMYLLEDTNKIGIYFFLKYKVQIGILRGTMASRASGPQLFPSYCPIVLHICLPSCDPRWQPQFLPLSLYSIQQERGKEERQEPTVSFKGQKLHISLLFIVPCP